MRVTSDVGPWSIVPEWLLDTEVSDRAVRLYATLGRYADRNGESFASRRTLASRLRCSVDSVDRAARELIGAGALSISARTAEDGNQTTNLYHLTLAAPVRPPLGTGAEGPLGTGAAQNESQLERKKPIAAAPRNGSRKAPSKALRDEVWDTLTDIFGPALTRSAETLRGKHVASLAEAGATRDEILRRAKAWPAHFDSATLTAAALEKHWDTLARRPLRRQ